DVDHQDLHSFPTRRSSDLNREGDVRFEAQARAKGFEGAGLALHVVHGDCQFTLRWFARERKFIRALNLFGNIVADLGDDALGERSEEHTSELQSLAYLVCR